MSQKNRKSIIRADNKKALPKFLAILLVCLVVGFGIGFGIGYFADTGAGFTLAVLDIVWKRAAAVLPIAVTVLAGVPSLILLLAARKRAKGLAEEDEVGREKAERLGSIALYLNGLHQLGLMFSLAVLLATIDRIEIWKTFLGLGLFFLSFIMQVAVQQKTVDFCRLLNPEKKGSIYSTKFQKDWMESCDEREKLEIYRCGYQGFRAGIHACLALFLVTAIGAMPFGYGPLPAAAVLLVWFVMVTAYTAGSMKGGKKK